MKSRLTRLLLTAVVAVWGVVAWKIAAPADPRRRPASTAAPAPAPPPQEPDADTLRADYPDPFLKGTRTTRPVRSAASTRSAAPKKSVREKVRIVHLGSVAVAGRQLHILSLDGRQYELTQGESAEGFVLRGGDGDSLYLSKNGFTYGVKRCL